MIESIQFKNFKALRDATLPLGRFTLIVGPNGSGKSTALQALQACRNFDQYRFNQLSTLGSGTEAVEVTIKWKDVINGTRTWWRNSGQFGQEHLGQSHIKGELKAIPVGEQTKPFEQSLAGVRIYSLDADQIAFPVQIAPGVELQRNGLQLPAVLDNLQQEPERFEALNQALGHMIPEFDRVLPETVSSGQKAFSLRTRIGRHKIAASDLSQGTRLALTLLTLVYLPHPPTIICLEEPDRGIHPRLLRDVQDAIYRLTYPEDYGETREPVQVIATTHSPYLLDLFRDRPEEVVIANKTDDEGTKFERLSDQPYIEEILRDSHLGDVWYTGILGGVPAHV